MSIEKKYWLGPSSWPQSLLAWLPFADRFKLPAKRHDIGYGLGGDRVAKNSTDSMFLKDMKYMCNWNPFTWLFAYFYFLSVHFLGGYYFNWSE